MSGCYLTSRGLCTAFYRKLDELLIFFCATLTPSSENRTNPRGPRQAAILLLPPSLSINISLSLPLFFTISQEDDQSKLSTFVPPAGGGGFDFLSAYSQLTQISSPESSSSRSGGTTDSLSINPQLMHTPAASKAASDLGEEEEEDDDEDVVIDDELHTITDHVLPTVKVGRGKSSPQAPSVRAALSGGPGVSGREENK